MIALAVGVGIGTWLAGTTQQETREVRETPASVSGITQGGGVESQQENEAFNEEDLSSQEMTAAIVSELGASESIARQISLADEWMATGYFPRAKAGYYSAMPDVTGSALDGLMFRIALCSELLGDYSKALTEYQRLSTRATSSVWSSASRLGEARCLAATGRTELLRTEILPLAILDESAYPVWIVGELLHLAGRSIVPEFSDMTSLQARQRLLRHDGLAVPAMLVEPEELLVLMDARENETYTSSGPPLFRLLQKTAGSPDGCYLQLQQENVAVLSLLDAVLKECEFESDISEAARIAVGQHGQTLFITDRSLSLILDGLCLKFGLVWEQDGGTLRFRSKDEAGIEVTSAYSHDVGERVLRAAVISAPDSHQSSASQLTLGVMLFQKKLYADAAHTFQLYMERHPHAELVGVASFNMAKSCLMLAQPDDARQHFLRCIDDNKTTRDLKICAYVNLGELQLAAGDTKPAISTLIRGLSQSRDHWCEVDCALMLASAYLLSDNPQGTNSILMERRSLLQLKPHVDAAAFLSAYSRFRRAAAPNRLAREAEAVVTSLSHLRTSLLLGEHWYLLMAAAYEDIGLHSDAIGVYQECLNSEPSEFIMAHCSLRLVDMYLQDGKPGLAEEILKAVPNLANPSMRDQTTLKKAVVAQMRGDLDTAVKVSETLAMEADNPSIKKAALKVLGSAYEQKGNPRAAVYCYAGMIPAAGNAPLIDTINHEVPESSTTGGSK